MSSIQNFYTSRDNKTDGNTYVGQLDRLWYNPNTNSIFVSDGVTPGGNPVALATNANITANNITVNTVTSSTGTITVTGNLDITGNISPASNVKIGGISAGPGVVISNQGELTIDTANLPLSFGNFTATDNILSIVNADEDMILQTEGNAEIQLIGNVGFYKPDGLPPDVANRFAFFNSDGQVEFFIPTEDPIAGAVKIIGSASGQQVPPAVAGVMLHITGQPNTFSTIYNDGANNFSNYIGRRYNGNTTSPTQVTSGQPIVRFSGQGYTSTGFSGAASGSLSLDALENFTASNQGAIWRFLVNPVAGNTRQEVANVSVANGVTATKFTTSGNIDGGNLNLTGNIIADYVIANNVGSTGNVEIESNETYWYFTTDNRFVGNGNIEAGNISVTGNIVYNIASNNAVVTQLISKSTPVTANGRTGQITTSNEALAQSSAVTFTVNNSYVSATDVIIISMQSGATANSYNIDVSAMANGSFNIQIRNFSNTSKSDAIVLNFAVIKVV